MNMCQCHPTLKLKLGLAESVDKILDWSRSGGRNAYVAPERCRLTLNVLLAPLNKAPSGKNNLDMTS